MPATTSRDHFRAYMAATLTAATTTTELLAGGITTWTEGVDIADNADARGCWTLTTESRDMSETSEDVRDKSGEAEFAVRATKIIERGENVYAINSILADAIERAIETAGLPAKWTHPVTDVEYVPQYLEIGLIQPSILGAKDRPIACIILYPVLRYERYRP